MGKQYYRLYGAIQYVGTLQCLLFPFNFLLKLGNGLFVMFDESHFWGVLVKINQIPWGLTMEIKQCQHRKSYHYKYFWQDLRTSKNVVSEWLTTVDQLNWNVEERITNIAMQHIKFWKPNYWMHMVFKTNYTYRMLFFKVRLLRKHQIC